MADVLFKVSKDDKKMILLGLEKTLPALTPGTVEQYKQIDLMDRLYKLAPDA